jgi:hypothetical protein
MCDQLFDKFGNSLPSLALRGKGGELANRRDRVGDCYRAFATFKKRVIVLGVTDSHCFMHREAELAQCVLHTACLIDAGG